MSQVAVEVEEEQSVDEESNESQQQQQQQEEEEEEEDEEEVDIGPMDIEDDDIEDEDEEEKRIAPLPPKKKRTKGKMINDKSPTKKTTKGKKKKNVKAPANNKKKNKRKRQATPMPPRPHREPAISRPPSDRTKHIVTYESYSNKRSKKGENENGKKRRKLKPGTKAKRAIKYYQNRATSGTFFYEGRMKNVFKESIEGAVRELVEERLQWEELNEISGKKYASRLLSKPIDKWSVSKKAVQKVLGAAQRRLDNLAIVSTQLHEHRKSVTVMDSDVALAKQLLFSY